MSSYDKFELIQYVLMYIILSMMVLRYFRINNRVCSSSHSTIKCRAYSWINLDVWLVFFLVISLLMYDVFIQKTISNNFTFLKNSVAKLEKSLGELNPLIQEDRHQDALKAIEESLVDIRGEVISLHQLEVVLEKYLSDIHTQKNSHQETPKAIKNIESNINSRTRETVVSTSIFGVSIIVLFVFGVLYFLMKLKGNSSLILGIITFSALLVSSFSIIHKIFDLKLVEDVSFILFSFSSKSENAQGEKIPVDYPNKITLKCPNSYTIGPFVTGKADMLENGKVFSEKIELLVRQLTDDSVLNKGELIILVGSADHRPLRSGLAALYGSNVGLAQARAISVKKLIKQQLQKPVPAIHVFSTGRSMLTNIVVPPNTDNEMALASDRSVKVCIIRTE